MTANLFAYGTLQFPVLLRAVTGLERQPLPAVLRGFRCEGVRGAAYPAIIADPAGTVAGMLYRGLPRSVLAPLDRFEGEMYLRAVHPVETTSGAEVTAVCYVIRPGWIHLLDGRPWDPVAFELLHLQRYLRDLLRE